VNRLGLFDGYGVELEYMIVDRGSLSVRPVAARLLVDEEGVVQSEVEHGPISWSNELVSHVLELKTAEPAGSLEGLDELFAANIRAANARLSPLGCALLGTGAHPFFDPGMETVIWPGEYTEVYRAYDRIFGVRGHGWSNLQSAHLNLPFADDAEFGRLHAAVRLVLPLIPALAASTPYLDGVRMPHLDARLEVYRHNQDRIPAMVGRVVPEAVFTENEYEERIFTPVLAALAEHDPEGVLNKYFANSRGAIARFDRGSIEIRVIDLQECPTADLAVLALIVAVVRAMVEERWASQAEQRRWDEDRLAGIFDGCVHEADGHLIGDRAYVRLFDADGPITAGELWGHIYRDVRGTIPETSAGAIELILEGGTLARRLVTALGAAPGRADFEEVYARLAGCLAENRLFDPVG
jgi:carboxylate-amine ligase